MILLLEFMRYFWHSCLVGMGLVGLVCQTTMTSLHAVEAAWIHHAWQTDDGLPNNDVVCLSQAADGAMMFATRGGLARLDGLRLGMIDLAPHGTSGLAVAGVFTTRDGCLWVIVNKVLVRFKKGEQDLALPLGDLRFDARVVAMVEDAEGVLWIGYENGPIFRVVNERLEQAPVEEGMGLSFASSLTMDNQGEMWAAGHKSLAKWRNGRFERVLEIPGDRPVICAAKQGGLWMGIGEKLFAYSTRDGLVELADLTGYSPGTRASSLYEDRTGRLWFGTFGYGLHCWEDGDFRRVNLPNQDVWWLSEDREGNVWVGTGGGGACRLRQRVLSMLNEPDAPVQQTARAFCEDQRGDVWVALQTGELFLRRDRRWKHLIAGLHWPGKLATSVTVGRNGDVWIATSEQSLVRWNGEVFETHGLPKKESPTRIRAMSVARDGKLWFGRGDAVVCGLPGQWTTYVIDNGGVEVQAIGHDQSDRVWAATQNGGLYRLEKGRMVFQRFAEMKGAGPVRVFLTTRDGAMWMGTARGGLARLKDGKVAMVNASHGLWSNAVSQLVLDQQGRLWGAGDRGIFAVSLSSLNAVADGRAVKVHASAYGRNEGVPSIQANNGYQPNAMAMASGRLWFASRSGIVMADPTLPGTNLIPPPVSIEGLRVNGREVPVQLSVALQPGVNTLRADLAAMSYVAPQSVTVWYRMDGVDDDWIDSGATRTATYGSLRPGHYQLRARATNNDGLSSRRDATLSLQVLPFFWQTLWFQLGLGGLFFLVTAVTAYRYSKLRTRRQTEAFKREADIQRERARIARDMHDQIGASLTQIALLAELADHEQSAGQAPKEQLRQLAETSREAVTHLDEIVWAVNPRHDNLSSLLEYVGQKAVQMFDAAGIRCRLELPDNVAERPLNADFRHHYFLMIQEAQNNAAKHSGASEITLSVQPKPHHLLSVLSDNGRGFDDHSIALDSLGNGLKNLTARAAALKGNCEIVSIPGTGTTITITLPWPKS